MKKFVILLAAIAMVGFFTVSSYADVSLYGSARFRTYSKNVDTGVVGAYTDRDTEWQIGYLTRFGAKFKSGDVGGRFELDSRVASASWDANSYAGSGASHVGDMRLRLNYGWWNFGSGQLMVGQNYPLFNFAESGINYYSGGLQKIGGVAYDEARTSQIRLTFGNFKIAFLSPETRQENGIGTRAKGLGTYATDVDTILPKIEVGYKLKLDPVKFNFVAGWQSYDIVNATDQSKDITSYVVAAEAKTNFGAAYVNLAVSYRVNGTNYGVWTVVNEAAQWNATTADVEDATTWGFVGAIGFKVSDMVTLEASYGKLSASNDINGLSNDDDAQAFGLLAKICPAPGVFIVPEFIYQDNEDSYAAGVKTDQGDVTIFGVFWRIDFK